MKIYSALLVLTIVVVGVNSGYNLMTNSDGIPVGNDQWSLTAGPYGPILLNDVNYIDKITSLNRERIPERVVHAKGGGAKGYFVVTNDVTQYTKADLFSTIGKQTPVIARFSTVAGESGSADTLRDMRGFAVKFYTNQGNWDLVGLGAPIFFINDPVKFPDFVHSQKRCPKSHLYNNNRFWDFLSQTPESAFATTWMFTDRGTPNGIRGMDGYGCHTFKTVNANGTVYYVKFHWRPANDTDPLNATQAQYEAGANPDYTNEDLYNYIDAGNSAVWNLSMQVLTEAQAYNYTWNVFDVTKVIREADYPRIPIGQMYLNKNPDNYFAEIEQAAFSPSHMVPGIEASPDRLLQGRIFAYPDTQRYRLGVNFKEIPVNCPYRSKVSNGQRDGFMRVDGNQGSSSDYDPSSYGGYRPNSMYDQTTYQASGTVGRTPTPHTPTGSDYGQCGALYRFLSEDDKNGLVQNIVDHMTDVDAFIQIKQIKIFYACDPDYGERLASALGVDLNKLSGLTYNPNDLLVTLVDDDF